MNQAFAVNYFALEVPSTVNECIVIVGRAIAAMVDSRHVRNAGAAMFFNREGAGFSVTCQSRQALEVLPQTFGSVMGHFGELERGEVCAVPTAENCQLGLATAPTVRS